MTTIQFPYTYPLEKLEEFKRSMASRFAIKDEIPLYYRYELDWGLDGLSAAKSKIVEVLDDWNGEKRLNFTIFFTSLTSNKLIDIANLEFRRAKDGVEVASPEGCQNDLYNLFENYDFSTLKNLKPAPESSSTKSTAVFVTKNPNLHKLVQDLKFDEFQNPLDRPIRQQTRPFPNQDFDVTFNEISRIVKNQLEALLKDQKPFKLTFTFEEKKIVLATTRMEKVLTVKAKGIGDKEPYIKKLITQITDKGFEVGTLKMSILHIDLSRAWQ